MSYIPNKCPFCGAALDPGERCDCESGGDELDRYLREEIEEVAPE